MPARNEEEDIADALHSILNQKGVNIEVIIINDHSTDRTGAIIDEIAQSDSRVTALHDPPLQPGWLGKASAMQYGAERATGDYLVFTDADILHSPTCFASALEVTRKHDYDFFSFFPLLINESVWEHINIPIYFAGMVILMTPSWFKSSTKSNALATGAFMLMPRAVFQECGGFECVKGNMFDDVGLARHLKANGYRLGYWIGPELSRVRMFKNAHDAFWGTTKNILGAVEGRAALALPLILVAIVLYWTPVLAVAIGIMMGDSLLTACGVGTYLIQYMSFFSIRRLVSFYPLKLLLFPLVVIVSTCCILRATYYQMKGMIFWRGRAIKVK